MIVDVNKVCKIIVNEIHGKEFYNRSMLSELIIFLNSLQLQIDLSDTIDKKCEIIKKYLKANAKIRDEYYQFFKGEETEFDKKELMYRTAYSAFIKKETTSFGYAEAFRVLLELYGVKSQILLSTWNNIQNNKILEYVVAVRNENGNIIVIDIAREIACEQAGIDFNSQLDKMIYIIPNSMFIKNKVLDTGFGITADILLLDEELKTCIGINNVEKLLEGK